MNRPVDAPLIVSLTDRGARLGARLARVLGAEHQHRPQPFAPCVQQAFSAGRRLLLICASGIAVRTLAPVLADKTRDPAVLVLDEAGQYVIPLLSGHEGGANHWAGDVAALLGARAVITSARQYRNPLLVAGMGCERHCPEAVLHDLLRQTLAQHNLTPADLSAISSIDLKADEVGLIQLAKRLDLPFICYPAAALRRVESLLQTPSEVVFREVGCYGVAEGAALYHAGQLAGYNDRCNSPVTLNAQRNRNDHDHPDNHVTTASCLRSDGLTTDNQRRRNDGEPPGAVDVAELLIPKHKNAQATVAIARAYLDDASKENPIL